MLSPRDLARFLSPSSAHRASRLPFASRIHGSPCLSANILAAPAPAELFPKLAKILRILDGASLLSHEELNSALQMEDVNWDSRPLVRKLLHDINHPETAFRFFTWVVDRKGFKPNTQEYNAVLELLGSEGMCHMMPLVSQLMHKKKCTMLQSTFTIMIKYYGKAGLVDEATNTLVYMKKNGVQPNVQTYNNLMHAFLKHGHLEIALGIYEQMLSAGVSPNEYTVNFLTDGFCNAGRLEEANKFVNKAPVSNIFVYNVLLKGICKAGKVEEGYRILHEMTTKGVSPDEYSYNTLVVGSCKAGKLDLALKLREEMVEKKIAPTLITYGTLITFLCKSKRAEEAFQLLPNMKSEGFVLTVEDTASLYKSFSKTRRKVSAAELLKSMTKGHR